MIKIGDFAILFNVSIKTIYFYEKKGLLKPAYVDIYSGYRYYDELNIEQMSKILALKELGLKLNEIQNIDNDLVQRKIKEYTETVKIISKNINILKTLSIENGGVKNLRTFVNDERAIGKWVLEGVYDRRENYPNYPSEFEILIKELYLIPNGKEYWVISWTKGIIYISGRENKYEIENDKMFVNLVDPMDNKDYKVAVYKKIDDTIYTIKDIEKKDDIFVPFVKDTKLIGFWECIDFINRKEEFSVLDKSNQNLPLKQLIITPDNKVIVDYGDVVRNTIYTKGYIINLCLENMLCQYEYRSINGKCYLIIEWKSGDYVYGGMINGYYVLGKTEMNA